MRVSSALEAGTVSVPIPTLCILCGCAWLDWPMSSTAIGLGEPVWSLKQQCPIRGKETIRNGSRAWQLRPWGIYVGESGTLELRPAHSMASVNSLQRTCFCCRKYLQTGLSLECRSVCNLFLCKPVDTYNKLLSLYTKKVERSRTFNKIMTSTRYSNSFPIPVRFDWYLKIVRKELTGLSTIVLFCHCSLSQP